MKKFLTALLCATLALLFAIGFTACNNSQDGEKSGFSFYAPDGAPALAVAQLLAEDNTFDREVNYQIVDSTVINTYVSGEDPKADLCILPVNAASLLLGTGEAYKMLGTVTHGNLFLLKTAGGEDVTLDNLDSLIGKTVGVINLDKIPGLTFKMILEDNDIEYNELGNDGSVDAEKVNLKAVSKTEVIPAGTDCDYFVVPEPAATTKVNATGGALSFAGDLQSLYGSENGYPQAVLVAKTSLIESDPEFIESFIAAVTQNAEWLLKDSTSSETIVNAVQSHLTEGATPTFTAENLNKDVIANCAINFVAASECKTEVNSFIEKLIAVNPNMAKTVSDAFYYVK